MYFDWMLWNVIVEFEGMLCEISDWVMVMCFELFNKSKNLFEKENMVYVNSLI